MQHAVWSNVQWLHVSWIVSYVEAKIVLLIKSPQKTSKQINSNQSVLKWKQTKKKKLLDVITQNKIQLLDN